MRNANPERWLRWGDTRTDGLTKPTKAPSVGAPAPTDKLTKPPKAPSGTFVSPSVPPWPPESLDCERRFGHPSARLYPLLGHRVETPQGPGELRQVLNETAAVVLDNDSSQVAFISWRSIRSSAASKSPLLQADLPAPRSRA